MDITITTEAKQCPRCHAFELILDERSHRDNDVEFCRVCGFVRDDRDGDIPLPHYSLRYSKQGLPDAETVHVEQLYGDVPVDSLLNAENWLTNCENDGYIFEKCVIVTLQGHVVWLRGNPSYYTWRTNA